MRVLLTVSAVSLVSLLAIPAWGQGGGLDPKAVSAKVLPGVVTVNCGKGRRGSGFFVAPDIVATSLGLISNGCETVTVKRPGEETTYASDGIAGFTERDKLVLIHLVTPPAGVVPLELDATNAPIGEQILVVGTPRGFEASITEGMVSSVRGEFGQTLQISAAVSSGSSGSPVVNDQAKVIGVVTSKKTAGESLNFAVSVLRLLPLLEDPPDRLVAFADIQSMLKQVEPKSAVPKPPKLKRYLKNMLVIDGRWSRAKGRFGNKGHVPVYVGDSKRPLTSERFLTLVGDDEIRQRSETARDESIDNGRGWAALGFTTVGSLLLVGGVSMLVVSGLVGGADGRRLITGGIISTVTGGLITTLAGAITVAFFFNAVWGARLRVSSSDVRQGVLAYNKKLQKKLKLESSSVPSGLP